MDARTEGAFTLRCSCRAQAEAAQPSRTSAKLRQVRTRFVLPLVLLASAAQPANGNAVPPCADTDVRVIGGAQGATGSMLVGLRVFNRSGEACWVRGHLGISVYTAAQAIDAAVHASDSGKRSARIVLLPRSQSRAFVSVAWHNYCGPRTRKPRMRVRLPHGDDAIRVRFTLPDPLAFPRCDDSSHRSSIVRTRLTRGPVPAESSSTDWAR